MIPKGVSLSDLLAWFASRSRLPTADDIRVRFGCSRATAYRWRALWQDECRAQLTYAGQPYIDKECRERSKVGHSPPRTV
jgi:hypothetical protein